VTLRKHTPNFRSEAERVWQYLEYDIAILGSVAAIPERREAVSVRGV
jgi:hypothetical protein